MATRNVASISAAARGPYGEERPCLHLLQSLGILFLPLAMRPPSRPGRPSSHRPLTRGPVFTRAWRRKQSPTR